MSESDFAWLNLRSVKNKAAGSYTQHVSGKKEAQQSYTSQK